MENMPEYGKRGVLHVLGVYAVGLVFMVGYVVATMLMLPH